MGIFPRDKTDRIVAYLLENPSARVKVSAIAKELKVSAGSVSITVKRLRGDGMVKGKQVNLDNPAVKALKVLLTVERLAGSGALAQLKKRAVAAGLYGSSSKGTDLESSDIDVWMVPKTELSRLDVVRLSSMLTQKAGRRVEIEVLSKGRLDKLRNESRNFYCSLVFGSVQLFGEGIE